MLNATERRVLRAYVRAIALVEPLQRELARRHGVSITDLYAVRVLADLSAAPVSRFGAELGLPRSTITNLVDRLERADMVERVPSPHDRRVTLVRLTDRGRRAVEDVAPLADSDIAGRLLALDPEAQRTLAEILERVVAAEPPSNVTSISAAAAARPSPGGLAGAAAPYGGRQQ